MKGEIVFVRDKKGGYTAFYSKFPNAVSEGETKREAAKNLKRLVRDVISYYRSEKLPIPKL